MEIADQKLEALRSTLTLKDQREISFKSDSLKNNWQGSFYEPEKAVMPKIVTIKELTPEPDEQEVPNKDS